MKKIALGSTSQIKKAAILKAFPDADVEIILNDVKSGVAEQPVGQLDTLLGATNRCRGAHVANPDGDIVIGIESGMWHTLEGFVDGACIVIFERNVSNLSIIWTDTLLIPVDHPRGHDNMWSCYKDPHSIITEGKRSRSDFIGDALLKWLEKK